MDHLIDAAINIAARSPDMAHLVRVASRLNGEARLVGWLHDSVEDGFATQEELLEIFPWNVVEAVMIVSRQDGETYQDFIQRIKDSGDPLAIETKIADLFVNLARATVDRFSLVRRYEQALRVLLNQDT